MPTRLLPRQKSRSVSAMKQLADSTAPWRSADLSLRTRSLICK